MRPTRERPPRPLTTFPTDRSHSRTHKSKAICGMDTLHLPEISRTLEIMDDFKQKEGDGLSTKGRAVRS